MSPCLFMRQDFISHSGKKLSWKIECDALTPEDWLCLAVMAKEKLPVMPSRVFAVPKGGLPFSGAFLDLYGAELNDRGPILLLDDVLTTGGSMNELRKQLHETGEIEDITDVIGIVAFARGECLDWVKPIWRLDV